MGGFPILETFFGTHACPCNNSGGSTNGGKGSSSSALQTPHPTHPPPLLFLHATATATAAVAAPHTPHNPVARQMDFAEQQQPQPVSPIPQVLTYECKPSAHVHVPPHVHPHSHPGQIAGSVHPVVRDSLMLIFVRCIRTEQSILYDGVDLP